MPFPESNAEALTPIMVTYCIDYRFNAQTAEFLDEIDYENSYYLSTNAGAALPLGYKKSCKNIKKSCKNIKKCSDNCCPGTETMDNLKKSFVSNLQIALTLKPITTVYLINHQDCGAIRAFLPCSGYPKVGELKNEEEICINAKILTYGYKFVKKKFKDMNVILGLIDSNGTVGDYDIETKKWIIIHVGSGQKNDALWFGFKKDDVITFNC